MLSKDLSIGQDYGVGAVPRHRIRCRVIGKHGEDGVSVPAQYVLVRPIDALGAVAGNPITLAARSIKVPWHEEVLARELHARNEDSWRARRDRELAARVESAEEMSPAFRGIMVSKNDIGYTQKTEGERDLDLADEIERFVRKDGLVLPLSLRALSAISDRIRQLSQEVVGATWVNIT